MQASDPNSRLKLPPRPHHHPCVHRRIQDESGFALLISLLVVLLLAVMILEMDAQTRADLRAAGHFRDDLQAFHLVRSAVSAAQALLQRDGRAFDATTELWASPIAEYPLGDGTLTAQIYDEAAKFNLNSLLTATDAHNTQKIAQFKRLLRLLEIPETQAGNIVGAVVDWIDADSSDFSPSAGAESGVYQRQNPPYAAKNARIETLGELRMIYGMSDELYQTVAPYLTVAGDKDMATHWRINLNTAHRLVMQSLDEGLTEAVAEGLERGRPYPNKTEIRTHLPDPALYGKVESVVAIGSHFFSVEAIGKVGEARKVAHALIQRREKTDLLYFKVE